MFATVLCIDRRNNFSGALYGDLVYRTRKVVGKSNFSEPFRKLISRYKIIGYNPYIMRQTLCLAVNPFTVDSYALLFNSTAVVRASDSMTASLHKAFISGLVLDSMSLAWPAVVPFNSGSQRVKV